jgi:hypothetical protein
MAAKESLGTISILVRKKEHGEKRLRGYYDITSIQIPLVRTQSHGFT